MKIFEFNEYREYLLYREATWPTKGLRQRLAVAVHCQPPYISQVFNGASHFSLEQAAHCNSFLEHSESEGHFFMLLLQLSRAGSEEVRSYFKSQIAKSREAHRFLQNRLQKETKVSETDQIVYYSSYIYALLHMAVTIKELNTPEAIAERFQIPLETVKAALCYLKSILLVKEQNGSYEIGTSHIHLERESPLMSRTHVTWRIKAIENQDTAENEDLHFSSLVSFSYSDWKKIREQMVLAIESIQKSILPSEAEDLFVMNMDLFRLKK